MVDENLHPTPGASGVTVVTTRFWPGDKLRYCIIEYWSCGAHAVDECCSACRKRVVAFRYRKRAASAVVDTMLAASAR